MDSKTHYIFCASINTVYTDNQMTDICTTRNRLFPRTQNYTENSFQGFYLFVLGGESSQRARSFLFMVFLDHIQRRNTVSSTPLDEWSVRHRDLYQKTHNTHNKQTSMAEVGFESTISAGERPQTYAL